MIYIMVILKMMGGEETSSGTINKMKREKNQETISHLLP